jgi:hypothetical protein
LQAVGASGQPLALLRRLGLARALGLPAERDSFLATLFRPFVGLTQPEVAH